MKKQYHGYCNSWICSNLYNNSKRSLNYGVEESQERIRLYYLTISFQKEWLYQYHQIWKSWIHLSFQTRTNSIFSCDFRIPYIDVFFGIANIFVSQRGARNVFVMGIQVITESLCEFGLAASRRSWQEKVMVEWKAITGIKNSNRNFHTDWSFEAFVELEYTSIGLWLCHSSLRILIWDHYLRNPFDCLMGSKLDESVMVLLRISTE